jgi:hypothetical protein
LSQFARVVGIGNGHIENLGADGHNYPGHLGNPKSYPREGEGMAFFLMGDLNANLHNPVLERDSEILALVASHGLDI